MFQSVKTITVNCPECSASITFPVEQDAHSSLSELYARIDSLKCPNCAEDLSSNAEVVRNIQNYNRAVLLLSNSVRDANVKVRNC